MTHSIHGSAGKKGGGEGGKHFPVFPHPPFQQQATRQIFKENVKGFSSASDTYLLMSQIFLGCTYTVSVRYTELLKQYPLGCVPDP
jgi:hypothetical protein